MSAPLILFDGHCALCGGIVRFIIRRDPDARFRFAPLQSAAAARTLGRSATAPPPSEELTTFVLLHEGRLYERSTAALLALRLLGWPWRAAWGLMIVPRPIRDAAYALVARNRYRMFGRNDACLVPGPAVRGRFLEE